MTTAWIATFVPSVLAFGLSAALTYRFSRTDHRWQILDYPNERSLHRQPVPRTGGVAIVIAVLVSGFLATRLAIADARFTWLAAAAVGVGGVAFIDDRFGVSPLARLIVHIGAAVLLVAAGYTLGVLSLPGLGFEMHPVASISVSLLFVIWMTNLYNFMDGMDGFAAGMATIGFASFAWLGVQSQEPAFVAVSAVIAAAALGFLLFNFPPASIFMGDTGSSTLGLLAAGMSLWGMAEGIFELWVPLLLFSPFIVDATVTLLRRIYRREKFWQAHKTHYYQRIVQAGWTHRRTVLWEYVLMVACSVSVVFARRAAATTQWCVVLAWVGIYLLLALFVRAREASTHSRSQKSEFPYSS